MKSIGIIANLTKAGAAQVVVELSAWLQGKGVTSLIMEDCAAVIGLSGRSKVLEEKDLVSLADGLIVLGGDGTLLNVARFPGVRAAAAPGAAWLTRSTRTKATSAIAEIAVMKLAFFM